MSNPWKLPPREIEVLDQLVKHGSNLSAAESMGLSHRTVESLISSARRRMKLPNRILVVLTWADYRRENPNAVPHVRKKTIRDLVVEKVEELGKASADTLEPELPQFTHTQIRHALYGAAFANRVHVCGKGAGKRSPCEMYAPGAATNKTTKPRRRIAQQGDAVIVHSRPASFVFDLGAQS